MPENKQFPTLSNPPIQLAVFEIVHNFAKVLEHNYQDTFHKLIQNKYPNQAPNLNRNIDLKNISDINTETTVKISKPEVTQYRYISTNKDRILLIDKEKFNLTVNKGYTRWEDNIGEFKELWSIFQDINPGLLEVKRISTRFINRIEIADMERPMDYFNTTIYANRDVIDGEIQNFLMRYTTLFKEDNIHLNVAQGFEPRIGNIYPYLFDIDVLSIKNIHGNDIWKVFEKLRTIKNNAFFSNLTDLTLNQLI